MFSDAPPIILTNLESLMKNKFQRNICLGKLNKDEIVLVRYYSLKNELIHNIPRSVSKTDIEISVWKPDKKELNFFHLLHKFLQSNDNSMIIYQKMHQFERKVAHYVAESIGLEHESIDTPEGDRRMTFHKEGVLNRSKSDSSKMNNDISKSSLSRSDTWSNHLSTSLKRSDTWNPSMNIVPNSNSNSNSNSLQNHTIKKMQMFGDYGDIKCDIDFQGMESIARIKELPAFQPSSPDMSTDGASIYRKPSSTSMTSLSLEPQTLKSLESYQESLDVLPIIEEGGSPLSRQMSSRVLVEVNELRKKVNKLNQLERITTGTGEVYLVVDSGTGERAIFKPAAQIAQNKRTSSNGSSEESSIHECPDTLDEEGSAHGTEILTHRKEVAAYQLDHFGFAGVLPTMESELKLKDDPATGMIQQYLEHDKTADEDVIGLTEINKLPNIEVHKIGLLDIRLFNNDRHGGNLILDQKNGQGKDARLVPIDHELTLPHWNSLGDATFCWSCWKQASQPFDMKTLDYIKELDIERDEFLLNNLNIPSTSIATYKICCHLLKICSQPPYNMLLKDIASIMLRFPEYPYNDQYGPLMSLNEEKDWCLDDGEEPSTLEKLVKLAVMKTNDTIPRSPNQRGQTDDEFGEAQLDCFILLLQEYLTAMRRANGFTVDDTEMSAEMSADMSSEYSDMYSGMSSGMSSPEPLSPDQPPPMPPAAPSSSVPVLAPPPSLSYTSHDTVSTLHASRQLEGQALRKVSAIN